MRYNVNIYCEVLIVSLFSLFLFSCKQHNVNKNYIKYSRISNFRILIQIFKNKNLFSEQEFRIASLDTIPDGLKKMYYDNGKLKLEAHFNNGAPEGIVYGYYPNGGIEYENFIYENKLTGTQKVYYSSGSLQGIKFIINDSNVTYQVYFDQHGKIINIEGHPQYLLFDKVHLRCGENFGVLNYVLLAKGYKTALKVILIKNNNVIFDSTIEKFKFWGLDAAASFTKKFNTPGVYHYVSIVSLFDSLSNKYIKFDTINTLKITVDK